MKNAIAVKRYVDAFLGYAAETTGRDAAIDDFRKIRALIRENPEFIHFLLIPGITYSEKCSFIESLLSSDYSEQFRQFLKLLLIKGRIGALDAMADFVRVQYSHGEEIEAKLKTSFPLDLDEIKKIKTTLEDKLHKKFKLYIDLDGSLLGGVQVTIGNTVIDGSVRRRLDELRAKLMTARVN